MHFLVDSLPLGSGFLDPHIFADPDPGSQNVADPTEPDPKHCKNIMSRIITQGSCINRYFEDEVTLLLNVEPKNTPLMFYLFQIDE